MSVVEYNINDYRSIVQEQLVTDFIKNHSNSHQLKSEEAIRNVIRSYADKFKNIGGMLTDAVQHHVNPNELISSDTFNDILNVLYIDLKTLYADMEFIDRVLNLNIARNKKFYSLFKKRIRELWDRLYITRSRIHDTSGSDQLYFESFSSVGGYHTFVELDVDKKTGVLSLQVDSKDIHNNQYIIRNVTSKTFPVHNIEGGVNYTSAVNNNLEANYKSGNSRDMLKNGLWKEQILCDSIPDVIVDITQLDGEASVPMYVSSIGVVSFIDIEFVSPVSINNIDLDVFGEYPLKCVAVLYKNTSGKLIPFSTVDEFKSAESFDLISIRNIDTVETSYIRLVLNQKNFDTLDSSPIVDIQTKVLEDLAQRRYDVVSLGSSDDDVSSYPSIGYDSLQRKINDIIEHTISLGDTLQGILNVFEPPPVITNIDFTKKLQYEIGLWSVEPSLQQFGTSTGKFDSMTYTFKDKPLILASIHSSQSTPAATTCGWYISSPQNQNKYIPLISDDPYNRKEVLFFADIPSMVPLGWSGLFAFLDFPIKEELIIESMIYINGVKTKISDIPHMFLNSTTIYFSDVSLKYKNCVIEYTPALYDCVSVYTLRNISNDVDNLDMKIMSPIRSVLNKLLNDSNKSSAYTITVSRITRDEYIKFFGPSYTSNMYISSPSYHSLTSIILHSSDGIYDYLTTSVGTDMGSQDVSIFTDNSKRLALYGSILPLIPVRMERII